MTSARCAPNSTAGRLTLRLLGGFDEERALAAMLVTGSLWKRASSLRPVALSWTRMVVRAPAGTAKLFLPTVTRMVRGGLCVQAPDRIALEMLVAGEHPFAVAVVAGGSLATHAEGDIVGARGGRADEREDERRGAAFGQTSRGDRGGGDRHARRRRLGPVMARGRERS